MRTLLVFDWFGEQNLQFFSLEDPPDWLEGVNGRFLNAADTPHNVLDLLEKVVDAISERGDWHQFEINDRHIPGPCKIVYCGCIP